MELRDVLIAGGMMMTRVQLLSVVILGLVGAAVAGPLGTTFTYQGILADAGAPVSGVVDLRFALWDAATAGTQVGSALAIEDTAVVGGRLTVPLDFGAVFNGNELWLAIEVRDGGSTGAYTLLEPRQPLTAAPYASHSLTSGTATSATVADHATTAGHATSADSATNAANATTATSALTAGHANTATSASTADDADTLDGEHGSHYLEWSNLSGKPNGLDDGDDDTLADLSCSTGEVASWDGSAWVCATGGGAAYTRTVVVGPVGDAAANGAALLAAVSTLPTPANQTEGWMIQLEPGSYDLGVSELFLPSWVSLRGSGRLVSFVSSAVCSGTTAAVVNLGRGELSDLSVENTCAVGGSSTVAIRTRSISDGARIDRVDVVMSQVVNQQIGIRSQANGVFITDVTVSISGSNAAQGLYSWGGNLHLIDNIFTAVGTSYGRGIRIENGGYAVISRGSYSGYGPGGSHGLSIHPGSVDASDASFEGDESAVFLRGAFGPHTGSFSRVVAHGQVQVLVDGAWAMEVRIEHSRVEDSVGTISAGVGTSVKIAATELDGGPIAGSGTVSCNAVWDEGGTFYPDTCP